ncbi:MAG: TOPRIM nucleotidyl transferase/hydrolase domain-containing protein [Actinomycetota bacterium]
MAGTTPRAVILVEGPSDRAAVETLARRIGRDLDAEGVAVVPMGGATSVRRFLGTFGPDGLDVTVAGLCDAAEAAYLAGALERTGYRATVTVADLPALGFQVCRADLEDELIRAAGLATAEEVLDGEGELASFRRMQRQPAQRGRRAEDQLRRFIACGSGRKPRYARLLAEALELSQTPPPLAAVLAAV